jgi:hypothetical protein
MTLTKAKEQRNTIIAVAIALILLVAVVSVVMYQSSVKNKSKDFLTITVLYANGVTDTYTAQNATKGVQLSILYNNIAVSTFECNLWVTSTYTLGVNSAGVTDSISSWSIAGMFSEELTTSSATNTALQSTPEKTLQPLWTFSGQAPQPSLVSGTPVEVASASYTAAQLQSLYSGWQVGQVYNVYNSFQGAVTINFAQAGAVTEPIIGYGTTSTTVTGMFQIEYISSSSFSITGAFAYS